MFLSKVSRFPIHFMIVNGLVDDLVIQKRKGVMCKLDMEKAFDYVSWKFIDYIL